LELANFPIGQNVDVRWVVSMKEEVGAKVVVPLWSSFAAAAVVVVVEVIF